MGFEMEPDDYCPATNANRRSAGWGVVITGLVSLAVATLALPQSWTDLKNPIQMFLFLMFGGIGMYILVISIFGMILANPERDKLVPLRVVTERKEVKR